jgi:hypothetical protein
VGKSKRNKRRDQWLDDPLAVANEDVRAAEHRLLEARRRAAAAAASANNRHSDRRRAAAAAVGASPEEQAEAFFNRPGDFYIAQFEIPQSTTGGPARAQCALKADEAQRDYLVEVMRQIRGAFGEGARISLSRAATQQQRVVDDRPPATNVAMQRLQAAHARAVHADEVSRHVDQTMRGLGEQPAASMWDLEQDTLDALLPEEMLPDVPELTREELQAQLPGMTRAEVAEELGIEPADIGGDIKGAETIEVEQLAAELGLSPLDLMPIDVRGGGRVYAVKPRQTQPPPGRHAAPEDDPSENDAGGAQ